MPDPLSSGARFGGSDNTAAYNTIHTMHYDTTAPNTLQSVAARGRMIATSGEGEWPYGDRALLPTYQRGRADKALFV